MRLLRLWLVSLCLLGCAVKNREPQTVQSGVGLPAGVQLSRARGYLFRGTPQALLPGEENTVTFQILDATLAAVDLAKTKLSIRYIMPTMPQMGVFRAEARVLALGKFEAVFDIVHGGLWRMTIQIEAEGRAADEVVFEYEVK